MYLFGASIPVQSIFSKSEKPQERLILKNPHINTVHLSYAYKHS